ncbi:hypothetical protein K7957_05970 [Sphingomonas yunnanensis]|uniref:hypothetical protein n=1 Tax=Sphingomonas yunnanensis TaxID=310400 RepID=UPI001CA5FD3F|nr:hypothetical protein [Sphingomonas yunnanensis]MBY9062475.1 hypothetical protein [Sphingomonas yunnanensis]
MVVRAGEWTIAIMRRESVPDRRAARWVIVEAFGYLAGDEGLAFATLFHARCWFICRLAQSGRSLLRGQAVSRLPDSSGSGVRALH